MRKTPAELLLAMRQKNPLVQCLQTPVSMDITANVLLAAGASPAMVCSEEETPAFLPKAGALYVNMGTLNAVRVGEIAAAIEAATRLKKPWWVLAMGMAGHTCIHAHRHTNMPTRVSGVEAAMLTHALSPSLPLSLSSCLPPPLSPSLLRPLSPSPPLSFSPSLPLRPTNRANERSRAGQMTLERSRS